MKRSVYSGFSLAEVVIAFVLISILILIAGGVMTSSYVLSAKLDTLPNAYYKVQDDVERDLDKLKGLVKEKFRIENELTNTPPSEIPPGLQAELDQINLQLDAYQKRSVALFGRNVELFEFERDHTSADGNSLKLFAGAANVEPIERPVPIIDKVTINAAGEAVSNEIYFGAGKTINSKVEYNAKNYGYHFRTFYQWYVCTGDYHTAAYPTDAGHEGPLYGRIFAAYPQDFDMIPGATGESIVVEEAFAGKFLLCVATPLSIGGKMGRSEISNLLYVSALPALSQGNYAMVIEPSLTTCDHDPSGFVNIDHINSRIPISTSLISTGMGVPRISLEGAATNSSLSASPAGAGNYSRYIEFVPGREMTAHNLPAASGVLFAVARSATEDDFIHWGAGTCGLTTNDYKLGGVSDTGWRIIGVSLASFANLKLVSGNLELAELVLVVNPNMTDAARVLQYLSVKYHIN